MPRLRVPGVRALEQRLIYLPSRGLPPPAKSVLPHAHEVTLRTSDGLALGAWFLPATGSAHGMAVLVANGNAGDRSLRAPLAASLVHRGLSVLLFDYRGYGGNPGRPGQRGLAADVRAARHFLVHEAGVAANKLIYFGESLGSAVVSELATEHRPAALVLRSPFVDLASVGQAHYPFLPVRALLQDRYPVAEYVAMRTCPATVVYGTVDTIVPPEQSRAVARAADAREVAVAGADHNDPALLWGIELIEAVVAHAEPPAER